MNANRLLACTVVKKSEILGGEPLLPESALRRVAEYAVDKHDLRLFIDSKADWVGVFIPRTAEGDLLHPDSVRNRAAALRTQVRMFIREAIAYARDQSKPAEGIRTMNEKVLPSLARLSWELRRVAEGRIEVEREPPPRRSWIRRRYHSFK